MSLGSRRLNEILQLVRGGTGWDRVFSCGAGEEGSGPLRLGRGPDGVDDDYTFTGRIQGGTGRYGCDLWAEDVLARRAALVGGWEGTPPRVGRTTSYHCPVPDPVGASWNQMGCSSRGWSWQFLVCLFGARIAAVSQT